MNFVPVESMKRVDWFSRKYNQPNLLIFTHNKGANLDMTYTSGKRDFLREVIQPSGFTGLGEFKIMSFTPMYRV